MAPYMDFLTPLLITIGCAGIIGFEREHSAKSAGLRTNILVALSSCFMTIIAVERFTPDTAARIVTGMITGMGFIGAGAIIHSGPDIRGLTSAATLWAVALLGVVIGLGYYAEGIIATILILLILGLKYLEHKIQDKMDQAYLLKNKNKNKNTNRRH